MSSQLLMRKHGSENRKFTKSSVISKSHFRVRMKWMVTISHFHLLRSLTKHASISKSENDYGTIFVLEFSIFCVSKCVRNEFLLKFIYEKRDMTHEMA